MLEQCLTWTFLGDLARVLENRLEMPVLLHQLGGGFVAYASHAGNVVRGISDQRQIVGNKFRSNSKPFLGVFHSNPVLFDIRGPATAGVEQPNAILDQLLKILVSRYHYYIHPGVDAFRHEGSDDIVSLVPG